MEVIRSDSHLPTSNAEGVSGVPPSLGHGLRQHNSGRPLRHQKYNELKTRSMNMASSLLG